jgi:hypothetical protein
MKTLISKFAKLLLRPALLCLFPFILWGSTLVPQKDIVKNDDSKSRKLDILEKIERGKTVSSEEIRASFSAASDNYETIEPYLHEMPPFQNIESFQGPFFYRYHDGPGHIIIYESDLKEIHNQIHENLEDLRKNIESFRNSEEFLKMQYELQKWSDKFRKELEKMKEELIKSEKESGSKGTVH